MVHGPSPWTGSIYVYVPYKVSLGVHGEDNKNKIPNQFCVIEKSRSLFA